MKFEKLNPYEAQTALKECGYNYSLWETEDIVNRLLMPTRSTDGSCGYDFHLPVGVHMDKGESKRVPLLIRVVGMNNHTALFLYNRSGLSLNKGVTLDNAVGVIDSDYKNGIVWQGTNKGTPKFLNPNDKIVQGVFHYVVFVDDDKTEGTRVGGLGSTGD